MSKVKKILLIVAVFIIIFIVVFLVYKYFVSKPTSQPPITNPPITNILPPPTENEKRATINEDQTSIEINNALQDFAASSQKNTDSHSYLSLQNKNKQAISLDEFSKATGLKINPQINNLLNLNDYAVFSCTDKNGKVSLGLELNVKLFRGTYQGDLYTDELKFMKHWENTILSDIKTILFPSQNFSESDLAQNIQFQDGEYRFANISLPDGTRGSINYTIVFDTILIANSRECLDIVATEFEGSDL